MVKMPHLLLFCVSLVSRCHSADVAVDTSTDNTASAIDETLWYGISRNAVSADLCRELITAADQIGFLDEEDSIDRGEDSYSKSQQIDIYDKQADIMQVSLFEMIEPILPALDDIILRYKRERWTGSEYTDDSIDKSDLGWAFIRKYAPGTSRNMLKLHRDSNVFTVNVALNGVDAYEGGGLFFALPTDQWTRNPDEEDALAELPENIRSYDFLKTLKRENTSEFLFPALFAGDVLIHNYTVWHGVAPLASGARYSLALFYDMEDNQVDDDDEEADTEYEVEDGYGDGDDDDDDDDEELQEVVFINLLQDEEVDVVVDLYWIKNDKDWYIVEHDMQYGEPLEHTTYSGHVFRAIVRETDELITEIEIDPETSVYDIEWDDEEKDEL